MADAAERFELLANETRMAIVRALASERRVNWEPSGMTFARLRRAAAVRDGGRFNYHLERLLGTYVEQRGDTYVLTDAGLEVVDAVLAGAYGDDDSSTTGEIDATCHCGRSLTATHEGVSFRTHCPEHGIVFSTTLPAGATAGRSPTELAELAVRDARQDVEWAQRGVCFRCWGRMDGRVVLGRPTRHPGTGDPVASADDTDGDGRGTDGDGRSTDSDARGTDGNSGVGGDGSEDRDHDEPSVVYGCRRCETLFWTSPVHALYRHPAVVAFRHDTGVTGVLETTSREVTVEATDPLRVAATFDAPDDPSTLRVLLDETATVVETRRST
jgi:hypothetical protein